MAVLREGERYYSLNQYLKHTYGEKLYKVSLDAGMTCPNRDGTLGSRGCIFCSAGGSGDFAADRKLSKPRLLENIPGVLILPIFRPIPIPMRPYPVCGKYFPRPSAAPISGFWILPPVRTALGRMCWLCWMI